MYKLLFAVSIVFVFTASAGPQDEAEYANWMKSIQPSLRAIRSASDTAAAQPDAQKLADIFGKVADFWKARHADDAVKFAETARDAAKAIASGSGDKAAHLQEIQGTCQGCHSAHREGTPPNFKIK
ncbi:MAG TPA: hypothetical protein VHW24_20265 [Bryobacteraceae bacterium]|jgi:hypothetical protein|nr:hypothetical protein [Bryobacteraceae bacterium]